MRIRNPKYRAPASDYVAMKKTEVQAWLAAMPAGKRFVTAADFRAQFPADADVLTDGVIAEIAAALGLVVEA